MLWTLWHRWMAGVRFAFNFYRHWTQLLLHQPGDPPVPILIQEGVNQGDPLLIVLYGIILVPLAEEIRAADLGLLYTFLCRRCGVRWFVTTKFTALKAVDGEGVVPGIFP